MTTAMMTVMTTPPPPAAPPISSTFTGDWVPVADRSVSEYITHGFRRVIASACPVHTPNGVHIWV